MLTVLAFGYNLSVHEHPAELFLQTIYSADIVRWLATSAGQIMNLYTVAHLKIFVNKYVVIFHNNADCKSTWRTLTEWLTIPNYVISAISLGAPVSTSVLALISKVVDQFGPHFV